MKMIMSFVKPYRFAVVIALCLMLIELSVELYQPFLISKIIDDGILQEDLKVVLSWGGVLIGFSLLAFAAGVINSFYSAHASQGTGFDIREKLYEKVQSFSSAAFDTFANSSLITRMTNDVTQVQNMLFMVLRIALRAPLLVCGGVIMALFLDVKLALVLVVAVPALLTLIIMVMRKASPLFRSIQQRLDRVNGVLQENLIGMRIIKAFLRRAHEIKRFTQASHQLRDQTIRVFRMIEITIPVVILIMNLCILFILWRGNFQVTSGETSVGNVVAIINYSMRIMAVMGMLSFITTSFVRAQASADRIVEVFETSDDLFDATDGEERSIEKGHIRFNQVSFRYPTSEHDVLKRISFEAKPGQIVAILGATGSGKSTLFQLIPRLYDVGTGEITIDGYNVQHLKFETLRMKIGYVPQQSLLFTGTIKDNILWGKEDATMEEIVVACQHAQIHETIINLPNQYDTIIGQRGVNLSGGQKQRLSIARALVRKPVILLMDDSTSALDASTEAHLLAEIEQYRCTTLLITQKVSTAMRADHIILLDDGELLGQGSHTALLEHVKLYKEIYDSQYRKGGVHSVY